MQINFIPSTISSVNIQGNSVKQHKIIYKGNQKDCFCKQACVSDVNFNGLNNEIKIIKKTFGDTKTDGVAQLFTLKNSSGAEVSLSSFGATIVSMKVPDKNGKLVDVVQGYNSVKEYKDSPIGHAGGTIGPCANKIGGGTFTLNGTQYKLECNKDSGKTHCHGASAGFDTKNWDYEIIKNGVKFSLKRPDNEGGYPGNLEINVSYIFDEDNKLRIDYSAKTDKDTILNMTNHAYFNLNGVKNTQENNIYNHILELPNSSQYTVNGEYSLPTGEFASVENSPMDFRTPKRIGDVIDSDFEQLKIGSGFDQNYCVDGYDGKKLIDVAKVTSPDTDISLKISTNLPGFQFYTANNLGKSTQPVGKDGKIYEKRSSFCIEPQFYPDAMAKFVEKPILRKGEEYNRTIVYDFGVKNKKP